jgi:hypothetical protein
MFTVFSLIALPFNLLGAPGFIFKIPVAVGMGFIADSLYFLFKKNKIISSLFIGGPILFYLAMSLVILSKFFNITQVMHLTSKIIITPFVLFGFIIVGAISGLLGYLIYNKIKNTGVVRRIQGG